MSQPYVGELRLVGFNFAPVGWMLAAGQTLAIIDFDVLFNLIGTTYGGDGQQTFQLPDLQGRVPVHQGSGFVMGQKAGVETVTLNLNQIPSHSHQSIAATGNGTSNLVQNHSPAANATQVYVTGAAGTPMNANMITPAGGSQPHENMQPYLVMNWVISLFGIFPSKN